MRITRLQLRNFMSWQCADVDFIDGVVAVIGPNGAGKSSILEAITWALWGKSRAISDNDLIQRGTGACAVSLDFSVSGRSYRIIRRRELTGRGSSSLELLDVDLDIPLTSQTIRDTQLSIDALIGTSYDLFMSSIMMAQGDSSRFSAARPGERKEILYQMLGLDWFETLEGKARTLSRSLTTSFDGLKSKLETRETDLKTIDVCEDELAIEKRALDVLVAELRTEKKELDRGTELLSEIDRRTQSGQYNLQQEKSARKAASAAHDRLVNIIHEVDEVQYIIASEDQINDCYAHYNELKATEAALAAARDKHEKLIVLLARLHAERTNLEDIAAQSTTVQASIDRTRGIISGLSDKSKEKEERLSDLRAQLETCESNASLAKERRRQAATRADLLEKERDLILSNIDAISSGTCPTCGQDVMDEGIINKQRGVVRELEANIETLDTQSENEHKIAWDFTSKIGPLETDIEAMGFEITTLGHDIIRYEQSLASLNVDLRSCMKAKKELENESYGTHIRQEMSKLGDVLFDPDEYQAVRNELEVYSGAQSDYDALNDAKRRYPVLSERVREESAVESDFIKQAEEYSSLAAKDTTWLLTNKSPGHVRYEIKEIKKKMELLEQRIGAKMLYIGRLESGVKRRDELLEEIAVTKAELEQHKEKLEITNLLVETSSKTGAPALIIELVLPLIEEAANRILSDLSPNTSITIKSQRQTQAGSLRETLDIIVYADGREVPLETLSGGERLRVDLALRLAMGDVMAAKTQAAPTMLFIDEGFGSQDPDGQQAIIDAITALYGIGRFDFILVITHVPAVANSFDTVYAVSKMHTGSVLEKR